jgi:hypothetical protein
LQSPLYLERVAFARVHPSKRNRNIPSLYRSWIAFNLNQIESNPLQNEKAAEGYPWRPIMLAVRISTDRGSTLAGLVALLRLVDHIDAALAAHDLAIAVTRLQRAE